MTAKEKMGLVQEIINTAYEAEPEEPMKALGYWKGIMLALECVCGVPMEDDT